MVRAVQRSFYRPNYRNLKKGLNSTLNNEQIFIAPKLINNNLCNCGRLYYEEFGPVVQQEKPFKDISYLEL